jgi:NAD(P)-dependent dehydrogenase (short-subunit alcohol dehydrogenase family)
MSRVRAQTVVITGASAGIGRAVALAFARRGSKVALIARGGLEGALAEVVAAGAEGLAIATDVADCDALFAAADQIIGQWGSIDVWINNAMVTVFAPVSAMDGAEFRRVTEVTYLGAVFGTMAALKHMRTRKCGTIVQVGSALSYRAVPLQSAYCGAKFAIRGFTDALRSELLRENVPIRVTMVQLPAINTPQFDWARNKTGRQAQPLPPIYSADAIAERIRHAAERSPRELWVGLATLKAVIGHIAAPAWLDRVLSRRGYDGQLDREPQPRGEPDNLFYPIEQLHATRGRFETRERTLWLSLNESFVRCAIGVAAAIVLLGLVLGLVML